jgi:MIP family channel proteins
VRIQFGSPFFAFILCIGWPRITGLRPVVDQILVHMPDFFRKLAAEALGTFMLVFAGTGAIVINNTTNGAVTHVGIALTFGLIVLAMIYSLGDVSGCHLNPAVTLGFVAARRFPLRSMLPYISAQSVGAIAASLTLRAMFPADETLGATLPAGVAIQSFVLEAILTFILMFVILSVSTGAKEKGIMAGVAVGSVIALEALFAGPLSGASMNPARSLAPALVALHFENLWIYLTAPFLGAVFAVLACCCVHEPGCCSEPPTECTS